jgi:acetoin utilization protein AcuC
MRTAILYSEDMKEYDLGHVLKGDRYAKFIRLFEEKVGDHPLFEIMEPRCAAKDDLQMVHGPKYIERIEKYESQDPHDTPLSPGFVRAAKLLAGAGKLAADLVQTGRFSKAVVVGGGVQHAGRHYEKGFGIFSDVGLCAENLMQNYGVKKILIMDTDAHAGDGIYGIFARDPRVLFVSLHQDTRTLYPGPSYRNPLGEGEGLGYSVNIPLLPGTSDRAYEYVLDEVFFPLTEEFHPEVILLVDGSDPHFSDQITQMGLTLGGIRMIGEKVRKAAEKHCQGKVIDFAGSGYDPLGVLFPRGWLASICGLTGIECQLEEPYPVPRQFLTESALNDTKKIVKVLKRNLAPYWECFTSAS